MVGHSFIPTTSVECPNITVTHGGKDKGFQLKSDWGTTFEVMILNEPTWGRIATYYETFDKNDKTVKTIPQDRIVVDLKESPPLVPKGAKLIRFPVNKFFNGMPQLWTLYFPPIAPATPGNNATNEERGDLATKEWQPPANTEACADSFFAALAQQTGLTDGDSVRRKMAEYIGSAEERRVYPNRTDEEREREWQRITKWGKVKGAKHWSEHGNGGGSGTSGGGGAGSGSGGGGQGGGGVDNGGGNEGGKASNAKDTAPSTTKGEGSSDASLPKGDAKKEA